MSSIELLKILEHSSTCSLSRCGLKNCNYMQQLAKHFILCNRYPCKICAFMSDLTSDHVQQCSTVQCMVVKCNKFKEAVSTDLSAEPSFPFVPTTTIIAPIIKCECLKIEVCESISEKSSFPPCFLKEKSLILLLPKSHVVNVIKLPVKKSRKSQANTLLGARRSAVLEEKIELIRRKSQSVHSTISAPTTLLREVDAHLPLELACHGSISIPSRCQSLLSCFSDQATEINQYHCSDPFYATASAWERTMAVMVGVETSSTPQFLHKQLCNRPAKLFPSLSMGSTLPLVESKLHGIRHEMNIELEKTVVVFPDPLLVLSTIHGFQNDPVIRPVDYDNDWMNNLLKGETSWL